MPNNGTYFYVAIRRGPMKVPTTGTSVFAPLTRTGTGSIATVTDVGFPPDLVIGNGRMYQSQAGYPGVFVDRLRGAFRQLPSPTTDAETFGADTVTSFNINGISLGADGTWGNFNYTSATYVNWFLKRAPSFFDEVCYTGTGGNRTIAHNLGVVPEMMIVRRRNSTGDWQVYAGSGTEYLVLNTTAARVTGNSNRWNSTTPTSSVFSLGTDATVNASGGTYVAYLFASCPGVSKVGSYTGNGSSQTIDCGFTSGARFILIKRTNSTGDWYAWDSARGIVSGAEPYLRINRALNEVTGLDYISPQSSGFGLTASAPAELNASGSTYIFLAIA
jgi:hypothetical protein